MKIWRINFTIDTGYDYIDRVCIIIADDEKEALENFDKWIIPKLTGDRFVCDSYTEIKQISADEFGVIYQDYTT